MTFHSALVLTVIPMSVNLLKCIIISVKQFNTSMHKVMQVFTALPYHLKEVVGLTFCFSGMSCLTSNS